MDTDLSQALVVGVTTFKTDALAQLGTILPIALGVAISVALLYKGISFFRSIAHV